MSHYDEVLVVQTLQSMVRLVAYITMCLVYTKYTDFCIYIIPLVLDS